MQIRDTILNMFVCWHSLLSHNYKLCDW